MPIALAKVPEAELPDRYEVVNGEVVELPPMSILASEIANRLRDHMSAYALRTLTGRTRMDMLFRIPLAEDQTRNREPDLAFIKFDRWPQDRALPYRGNPIDVVPNVALEVVSPSDFAEDVLAKAYEYLRAGVELVWVIFPRQRQLFAFFAANAAPRLFTETDVLDGGTTLPDFAVPMAGLFPAVADEPAAEPGGD